MLIKHSNFCTCKYESTNENIPLIAITLISGLNAYFTHTLNHFPEVIDICHKINFQLNEYVQNNLSQFSSIVKAGFFVFYKKHNNQYFLSTFIAIRVIITQIILLNRLYENDTQTEICVLAQYTSYCNIFILVFLQLAIFGCWKEYATRCYRHGNIKIAL